MICTSLQLYQYLQHEKSDGTPYRRIPSEKKTTGIVADTVANVVATLLRYQ